MTTEHEDLLCARGAAGSQSTPPVVDRKVAAYANRSERFVVTKRTYAHQYSQLYFTRMMLMAPRVREAVARECPNVPIVRTLDLEKGVDCVLVGTLYKSMKLKPSVLDEYVKERSHKIKGQVHPSSMLSETDYLMLEDENSRVRLIGDAVPVAQLVTGVVMAVRGKAEKSGSFTVTQVVYSAAGPQTALSLSATPRPGGVGAGRYVAMVSGLAMGSSNDPLLPQLLIDHLVGLLGTNQVSGAVVRVVVAGDSLVPAEIPQSKLDKKDQTAATAALQELDLALTQLAAAVPVDIMPGVDDFANHSLPQQPLHACLFPGATSFSTFNRVTNPYDFECEGANFLGTSGQNIDNLDCYCSSETRLDLIEATLRWQHLAPSAPDTLAVYPFVDSDPFVLERSPHVYFVGNQPEFATRLVNHPGGGVTRVVALPKFAKTGVAVLLDVETLEVHPLSFSTETLQ